MPDRQPIEWRDDLCTGITMIDRQHRVLISILRDATRLHADNPEPAALLQATRDLLAYAIFHFEVEERLMHQYGYDLAAPEAAADHLRQHRAFSQRAASLHDGLREGGATDAVAVLEFIEDWLIDHIQHVDQALGRFVIAYGGERDTGPA